MWISLRDEAYLAMNKTRHNSFILPLFEKFKKFSYFSIHTDKFSSMITPHHRGLAMTGNKLSQAGNECLCS